MDKTENLEELRETVSQEAFALLERPYAAPSVQLELFEGFLQQKPARTGKKKWDFQDELLAQFLARGYTQIQAYKLSHPEVKTQNLETLYPNASRACNRSKVIARVEAIKKELEARALMSTTEYFFILNEMARGSSKDKAAAVKMIGQVKGLFQAEKGLPGTQDAPLVICWPEPTENRGNK